MKKKKNKSCSHSPHSSQHILSSGLLQKGKKCWCRNRRQQSKRGRENGQVDVKCWLCHLLVAWFLVGHWTLMSKCSCLRNGSIAAPASLNYMDHMGTVSPQVVGAHWTPVELSFKREAAWLFLLQQFPACSSSCPKRNKPNSNSRHVEFRSQSDCDLWWEPRALGLWPSPPPSGFPPPRLLWGRTPCDICSLLAVVT